MSKNPTSMGKWGVAVVALAAVLLRFFLIPSAFETTDGVNFALALERFDLAQHQPHFPGYPLFVVCARALHWLLGGANPMLALALLGIVPTFLVVVLIWRAVMARAGQGAALASAALVAASPPLVLVAATPQSDGFALSLLCCAVAIAFIATEPQPRRPKTLMLAAGLLGGLALGVRPSFAPLVFSLLLAWTVWDVPSRLRRLALVVAGCGVGVLSWLIPFLSIVGIRSAWTEATRHTTGHFEAWGGAITSSSSSVASRMATLTTNTTSGLIAAIVVVALLLVASRVRGYRHARISSQTLWLMLAGAPYVLWVLLAQNVARPRHAAPLGFLLAVLLGIALVKVAARFQTPNRGTRAIMGAALLLAIGLPLASSAQRSFISRPPASGRAEAVRWIGAELGVEGVLLLGTQTPRVAHYYMPGLRTGLARHGSDVLRVADRYQNTQIVVVVTSDVPNLEVSGLRLETLAHFGDTTVYAATAKATAKTRVSRSGAST